MRTLVAQSLAPPFHLPAGLRADSYGLDHRGRPIALTNVSAVQALALGNPALRQIAAWRGEAGWHLVHSERVGRLSRFGDLDWGFSNVVQLDDSTYVVLGSTAMGPIHALILNERLELVSRFPIGGGVTELCRCGPDSFWVTFDEQGGITTPRFKTSCAAVFSTAGDLRFELNDPKGGASSAALFGCYAMNRVDERSAWFYSPLDNVLVEVSGLTIVQMLDCPVDNARGFAVRDDTFLFYGVDSLDGYGGLWHVGERTVEPVVFVRENDIPFYAGYSFGVGERLFLCTGSEVLTVDVW